MSFYRKMVGENPRLMSSYCESCLICVAVSTHEGLLRESETSHTCRESDVMKREAQPNAGLDAVGGSSSITGNS